MAVIDPADLPADDQRPIYDDAHMPGGPWRTYRSREVVAAVRVRGDFLVRRPSDGMLVEFSDVWVTVDTATGDPAIVQPASFATKYEVLDE
jgi:hypothetical protein